MPSQFQGLRIDQVNISRRDSENNAVGLRDVFGDEVSRLLLDIGRLVANGYLRLSGACYAARFCPRTFVRPGRSTSVKLRTCGE